MKGREAAEKLKAEGNAAYQKQKYGAALDVSVSVILWEQALSIVQ